MANRLATFNITATALAFGLSLPGCSPAAVSVNGSVTVDGQPLDEAAIVFVPLKQGRSKTGATVVKGHYALPAHDGLLPGTYRVEIVDNPPLDYANHHPAAAAGTTAVTKKRRHLPPRYSHKSPLRIVVPAEGARTTPIEADFELEAGSSRPGRVGTLSNKT
jgi:hypothetical protein